MSFGEGNLRERVEQLEARLADVEQENKLLKQADGTRFEYAERVRWMARMDELRNKNGALEDELADKTEFIDHQEREIAELEFEAKYSRRRIEELNSELVQQIKLITRMWSEICSCPEYRDPPCMTDEICGLMREFGFRQIIEQRNEEP